MNHFNNVQPKHWNSRGQSLVELALLLPFLLIILLGIVEYSNMFMMALRASNLSREVANASFRNCSRLNGASMASCLNENVVKVGEEGQNILSGFDTLGKVIATAYEHDAASNPPVRFVNQQTTGAGNFASRYSTAVIDTNVINTHDRIVVGEVIYPYVAVTPLKSLLDLLNIRTVIYEVTIY